MRLARALELTHNIASTANSIEGLDALLDPSLVEQALEQAGVATLRKRRLPTQKSWHEAAGHPRYDSTSNQHGDTGFLQVRMVCRNRLCSTVAIRCVARHPRDGGNESSLSRYLPI